MNTNVDKLLKEAERAASKGATIAEAQNLVSRLESALGDARWTARTAQASRAEPGGLPEGAVERWEVAENDILRIEAALEPVRALTVPIVD
ncbi:MAG: hypothetical protein JNK34_01380 [Tabrizicola sp.]|nr:hypothetical protein [Tabrizicola sp.]